MTELSEKVDRAIQALKMFEPEDEPYYLCYSGGKDSDCIRILAELAGVEHDIVHNLTTVDVPETIAYIKSVPNTQTIQPYEYGHPYSKKTCLWLRGLPKLRATEVVKPFGSWICGNAEVWKRQAAQGKVYGKEKSAKHRSKTFPGIAQAMAQQWGDYLLDKTDKQLLLFEEE